MTNEDQARADIVRLAKSLFDRGFSVGSAGNISCTVEDGILITPTNSSLGFLSADRISKISRDGRHISGDKPSKEIFLHRAFYESRPSTGAVVHLHSTYCTALSCLADVDPQDCIPSLTPYVIMRVGQVPIVPYVRPGDEKAGRLIDNLRGKYAAVLLANHGPVVAGRNLESAVFAAEELEETAKLLIILRTMKVRYLTEAQVEELAAAFGKP
ncbi:class II aldolase [Mesorhizobium sp. 131-3-5]|uniref:3-oxo-tetronate 4-phosphate decarboxylase n=1 Tax=Mesorhizobium sp. 131-3-5 TaxID=2744520 RepID=UPI001928D9F7|nr:3-oxo-tetronate 4-phosphate decarboxylase [Mesorhizobium sp. 131-3-5]BCH08429.1 class II aldolase [Mesorhizobium sp. 131-3-5]